MRHDTSMCIAPPKKCRCRVPILKTVGYTADSEMYVSRMDAKRKMPKIRRQSVGWVSTPGEVCPNIVSRISIEFVNPHTPPRPRTFRILDLPFTGTGITRAHFHHFGFPTQTPFSGSSVKGFKNTYLPQVTQRPGTMPDAYFAAAP